MYWANSDLVKLLYESDADCYRFEKGVVMLSFDSLDDFKKKIGGVLDASVADSDCIFAVGFDQETIDALPSEGLVLVIPKGVKSFFDGKRGIVVDELPADSIKKYVYLIDNSYDVDLLPSDNKIVVSSVLDAVLRMSVLHADFERAKLIAVTGTVGKTSTKNIISTLLKEKGTVGFSRINKAYSILKRGFVVKDFDYKLFEVSAHALNVSEKIVRPNVAVLTSVGEGHVEKYGDLESIFEIKARVLKNIKPGGVAVVSREVPFFEKIIDKLPPDVRLITYGDSQEADIRLVSHNSESNVVQALIFDEEFEFYFPLPGRHNAINALGAIAVMTSLGHEPSTFLHIFEKLEPVRGRGRTYDLNVRGKRIKLIDDSYNANPLSMKASIESFTSMSSGGKRKILVLGDMLELGESSSAHHESLLESINASGADKVYLVGEAMAFVWPKITNSIKGASVLKSNQLLPLLRRELKDGDMVLIKSSNSVGLSKLARVLVSKSKETTNA